MRCREGLIPPRLISPHPTALCRPSTFRNFNLHLTLVSVAQKPVKYCVLVHLGPDASLQNLLQPDTSGWGGGRSFNTARLTETCSKWAKFSEKTPTLFTTELFTPKKPKRDKNKQLRQINLNNRLDILRYFPP